MRKLLARTFTSRATDLPHLPTECPLCGVKVVDGLLTGWHEPEASHLRMLEAIAGRRALELAYAAALESGHHRAVAHRLYSSAGMADVGSFLTLAR